MKTNRYDYKDVSDYESYNDKYSRRIKSKRKQKKFKSDY